MSPHPSLHPRSRLTTSLFTTTLLLSFLVVGMPHILPCPRPRLEYSDTEDLYQPSNNQDPHNGRKRRPRSRGGDECGRGLAEGMARKQEQSLDNRICGEKGRLEIGRMELAREEMGQRERELMERRRRGHECPVPKPGGWVGGLLGFRAVRNEDGEGEGKSVVPREKGGGGGGEGEG